MYGWRGRIGVIIPADNAVMEPEFHLMLPDGVSAHAARLKKCPRPQMPVEALELVKTFNETKVNLIAYMCAASSFVMGPKGNAELCTNLISRNPQQVPPRTSRVVQKLDTLRAVLSPHPPDIADKLKEYLEESGFEVTTVLALGLDIPAINNTSPGDIYRHVRSMDLTDADAIFIAATNFRAIDVIEAIEADIGLPGVSSNQVVMWDAMRKLGIADKLTGLGKLWSCD